MTKGLAVVRSAELVMDEVGLDPIEAMATMATDSCVKVEVRATLLKELAQYKYPKKGLIAKSSSGGITVNIKKFVINESDPKLEGNIIEGAEISIVTESNEGEDDE